MEFGDRPVGGVGREARDPPESLIAWGIGGTSDLPCRPAEGDDPERWRVAVYSRGIDGWVFTDCGMVESLYRALSG